MKAVLIEFSGFKKNNKVGGTLEGQKRKKGLEVDIIKIHYNQAVVAHAFNPSRDRRPIINGQEWSSMP